MNAARWSLILCCGLASVPALAQEGAPVFEKAGPNLLAPGDFEDGALARAWKVDRNRGGFRVAEVEGRMGGTAASLVSTVTTGRGKFFAKSQDIPVGSDIRVTVWARPRNHLGGTWAVLEGKGARGGQEFHIAGGTSDWVRYEYRTTVAPKGVPAGAPVPLLLWFYVYGRGEVCLDDVEIRVITPDAGAREAWLAERARDRVKQVKSWRGPKPADLGGDVPYDLLVRTCAAAVTRNPAWGVLATDGLRRVFRDRPFRGPFRNAVALEMARHEYEGAQLLIFAYDGNLEAVKVEVDAPKDLRVEVLPVVYGDRSRAPKIPWYGGAGSDAWPDPLVGNRSFAVAAETVQPVYLRVYCPPDAAPGERAGTVTVTSSRGKATLPFSVRVHRARMPRALTIRTMTVAGPSGKAYVDLALQQRMGIGNLYAGLTWTRPRFPGKGNGLDFSGVEADLRYAIDRGQNAFILASTPKSGSAGFAREYSDGWKRTMSGVVREYGAWLKQKGWLDKAYYNNIDEPAKGHWGQVKEIYAMAKAACPEVKVFSCINVVGALDALKDHADTFDVYVPHHYQQQGPAWQKDGKELWWAVCIWPDERPNLFVECPLLDARIIGWLAFQHGVTGFEYWALASWRGDWKGRGTKPPADGGWLPAAGSVLTSGWPYDRNRAGDGYLVYPGPEGGPLNSLRFEALRDGLEDSELLVMLRARRASLPAADRAGADALLKGGGLVVNAHLYGSDPERLLDVRRRILALLDR